MTSRLSSMSWLKLGVETSGSEIASSNESGRD